MAQSRTQSRYALGCHASAGADLEHRTVTASSPTACVSTVRSAHVDATAWISVPHLGRPTWPCCAPPVLSPTRTCGRGGRSAILNTSKEFFSPVADRVLTGCRYIDALTYSIDGNFHLGSKAKATDPKDIALSEGAGYFVNTKDFKTYLNKSPEPPVEVCSYAWTVTSLTYATRSAAVYVQPVRRNGRGQIQRKGVRPDRYNLQAHVFVARRDRRPTTG